MDQGKIFRPGLRLKIEIKSYADHDVAGGRLLAGVLEPGFS